MKKETLWYGFRRLDFLFEGMDASLVFPKQSDGQKNWLLKTEYFDAFPELELELVRRGWHLAYVKNVTRWCLEEDLERKARFVVYLTKEYGLRQQCVPVGLSCGGLIATKLAANFPDLVLALYLDAPVMNLLSCPAALGASQLSLMEEFTKATGIELAQLICYREHPIDKMHLLLENGIPIVMVYGDRDTLVPYEENGAILEDFYKKHGGVLLALRKENCDHHPHGPENPTPVIEFLEKLANKKTERCIQA